MTLRIWEAGSWLSIRLLPLCLLVAPTAVLGAEGGVVEHYLAPDRAYLGARITSEADGVRVIEIYPASPAERVGLRVGDVIFRLDGEPLRFENDLEMVRAMGRHRSGQRLELDLRRQGEELTVALVAEETPPELLARLSRWIDVAEERLGSGQTLYCEEPGEIEEDRWGEFLGSLGDRQGEVRIARERGGAITIEVEPPLPAGSRPLAAGDLPEGMGEVVAKLQPGEVLRLEVTPDSEGKSWKIRMAGELPQSLVVDRKGE
jgi:hypothetical protein